MLDITEVATLDIFEVVMLDIIGAEVCCLGNNPTAKNKLTRAPNIKRNKTDPTT